MLLVAGSQPGASATSASYSPTQAAIGTSLEAADQIGCSSEVLKRAGRGVWVSSQQIGTESTPSMPRHATLGSGIVPAKRGRASPHPPLATFSNRLCYRQQTLPVLS